MFIMLVSCIGVFMILEYGSNEIYLLILECLYNVKCYIMYFID